MQEPTKYDSVFWIETAKIHPNPYQPRKEFDDARLKALAESIRQYGVLQPLVVTRTEHTKSDGGIASEYELIAGERRLRASKLAGLTQVPAVIRGKEDGQVKLELAIIENLQREDLNSIDRAKALAQLAKEFGISHSEIGAKIGRSREYVSNSIRLLQLPEKVQQAVVNRELSEGHARALLMLSDRPEEQDTLFRDIVLRKTSVRVTEQLVRRIATDKIRKHNKTQEMMELEKSLTETLGTRVVIENRPNKTGRLLIEFFSQEDLTHIAEVFAAREAEKEIIAEAEAVKEAANEAVKEAANETTGGVIESVSDETADSVLEEVANEVAETTSAGSVDEVAENAQSPEAFVEETIVITSEEAPTATTNDVKEEEGDGGAQVSGFVEVPANEEAKIEEALSEMPVIEVLKVESTSPSVTESPSTPETSPTEEATASEANTTTNNDDSDDELYSVRNFTI